MKESIKKLVRRLNFTPTERKVVLFLVGAFLFGLVIRFIQLYRSGGPDFDYSEADAAFASKVQSGLPGAAPATAGMSEPGEGSSFSPAPVSGRININSATKEELMALPGVGEAIAERIILYRDEHGAFSTLEDLMKVKGIGRKKFDKIARSCAVEDQ